MGLELDNTESESPETSEPVVDPADDMDALRAAAKAAREEVEAGQAPDDATIEAKAKEERVPEKGKKPEPAPEEDEDTSVISKALKEREKVQGRLAEAEAREARAQAREREAEQAAQQAKQILAETQREYERIARIKQDPVKALTELGWSAEDIINHAANEKNPEWQAKRQLDDRFSKFEAALAERDAKIAKLEAVASSYDEERTTAAEKASQEGFLSSFPDESPIRKLYSDEYILDWAYKVQDDYRARTRKNPSIKDLCDYLHAETLKRVKALGVNVPQESVGKTATKAKANGARGLTQKDASSRLAPPQEKDVLGLADNDDDLREYLISVAQEAKQQRR